MESSKKAATGLKSVLWRGVTCCWRWPTSYEGTVQHGQLSGHGKLTMPDGATYDGQWLAGKQDGKGVQSMPDGTRYEGEWKNGQPNGHGVLRDAKGKTVEGEWKNGAYLSEDKDNDDDQ